MEGILDKLTSLARTAGQSLLYVGGAAVALIVVVVLWKLLFGRRRTSGAAPQNLTIDVMALGAQGPPPGGPTLEFYNTPVRLAAIVLAPAGRVRDLPPESQWGELYDAIVPELSKVVAAHRPLVRRWPAQASSKGFAHQFFQHVRLPGQGGKGSPWSSAAGLMKIEGQAVMAGMVFRTADPSAHGQEIIDSEEHWLRILRVKR